MLGLLVRVLLDLQGVLVMSGLLQGLLLYMLGLVLLDLLLGVVVIVLEPLLWGLVATCLLWGLLGWTLLAF